MKALFHLSGVEAKDLKGRQIPEDAQCYADLSLGKVVVELREVEKVLVNQVSTLNGDAQCRQEYQEYISGLKREMHETAEESFDGGSKCLGGKCGFSRHKLLM